MWNKIKKHVITDIETKKEFVSNFMTAFDDPTKIEFTEATLPLTSSGVLSCRIVWRMIIETPSVTPYKNNDITDTQKIDETPKAMIDSPKPKIAISNFFPEFLVS